MSGTRKVQLTIAINFISSKDNDGEQVILSKSDNTEVITYDNVNEFIKEIFESHCSRFQIGLETSTTGSAFIFDDINLLYYKCHKKNFRRGGSRIDFSRLNKKQKSEKKSVR